MSEPPIHERLTRLIVMPGSVPKPSDVTNRCAFAHRCKWVSDICLRNMPQLQLLSSDHASACLRLNDIADQMRASRAHANGAFHNDLSVPNENIIPIVQVTGLTKTFGRKGAREVKVLNDVTPHINKGEMVALVGESGSGKSTIGHCLLGLEIPDSG